MSEPITPPSLREHAQIQRAHDVLAQLMNDISLLQRVVRPSFYPILVATMDALCWVLQHEDDGFDCLMEYVEHVLRQFGIAIEEHSEYFVGKGPAS